MILGQRRPFAAPPVNVSALNLSPVSSLMMSRCPRATYAAASSIARTQAPRPLTRGPPRSNRDDSAGSRRHGRGCLLHQDVRVDAAPGRKLDFGVAERIAEPAHAHAAVEADALEHPLAGHDMAESAQPGLRVDDRLVEKHGVLPERAGDDVVLAQERSRAEEA
jgi:hypothetical protein